MNITNELTTGTILKGKAYNYRIEKALGQGSFGITYLASVKIQGALGELDSSIHVAIKEFFMKETNGRNGSTVTCGSKGGLFDKYRVKFAREAQNLSKLHHSNIVKVLESFEANNTVYYAMEYIDGGSLDDYISKSKGLSEKESIKYLRQIGEALSYMHHNKMLHLDLKPANIVLRKNGEAVLIDFGLAKQYDDNGKPETSTSVGMGTPGYAPLEQANYQDGHGFPVTMDVYALGATMFKMLTGVRAIPDASSILNDGFPIYELQKHNVSDSLISVVAKAMAPLKKNRYQNIDIFLDALDDEGTKYDETEDTYFEVKKTDTKTTKEKNNVNTPYFTVPPNTQHIEISYREYGVPYPSNFDVRITRKDIQIEHFYLNEQTLSTQLFTKKRFQNLKNEISAFQMKCTSEKREDFGVGGTEIFLTFIDEKYNTLNKISTRVRDDNSLYILESNKNIAYEIERLLPEVVEFISENKQKLELKHAQNNNNQPLKGNTSEKEKSWLGILGELVGLILTTYLPLIGIILIFIVILNVNGLGQLIATGVISTCSLYYTIKAEYFHNKFMKFIFILIYGFFIFATAIGIYNGEY